MKNTKDEVILSKVSKIIGLSFMALVKLISPAQGEVENDILIEESMSDSVVSSQFNFPSAHVEVPEFSYYAEAGKDVEKDNLERSIYLITYAAASMSNAHADGVETFIKNESYLKEINNLNALNNQFNDKYGRLFSKEEGLGIDKIRGEGMSIKDVEMMLKGGIGVLQYTSGIPVGLASPFISLDGSSHSADLQIYNLDRYNADKIHNLSARFAHLVVNNPEAMKSFNKDLKMYFGINKSTEITFDSLMKNNPIVRDVFTVQSTKYYEEKKKALMEETNRIAADNKNSLEQQAKKLEENKKAISEIDKKIKSFEKNIKSLFMRTANKQKFAILNLAKYMDTMTPKQKAALMKSLFPDNQVLNEEGHLLTEDEKKELAKFQKDIKKEWQYQEMKMAIETFKAAGNMMATFIAISDPDGARDFQKGINVIYAVSLAFSGEPNPISYMNAISAVFSLFVEQDGGNGLKMINENIQKLREEVGELKIQISDNAFKRDAQFEVVKKRLYAINKNIFDNKKILNKIDNDVQKIEKNILKSSKSRKEDMDYLLAEIRKLGEDNRTVYSQQYDDYVQRLLKHKRLTKDEVYDILFYFYGYALNGASKSMFNKGYVDSRIDTLGINKEFKEYIPYALHGYLEKLINKKLVQYAPYRLNNDIFKRTILPGLKFKRNLSPRKNIINEIFYSRNPTIYLDSVSNAIFFPYEKWGGSPNYKKDSLSSDNLRELADAGRQILGVSKTFVHPYVLGAALKYYEEKYSSLVNEIKNFNRNSGVSDITYPQSIDLDVFSDPNALYYTGNFGVETGDVTRFFPDAVVYQYSGNDNKFSYYARKYHEKSSELLNLNIDESPLIMNKFMEVASNFKKTTTSEGGYTYDVKEKIVEEKNNKKHLVGNDEFNRRNAFKKRELVMYENHPEDDTAVSTFIVNFTINGLRGFTLKLVSSEDISYFNRRVKYYWSGARDPNYPFLELYRRINSQGENESYNKQVVAHWNNDLQKSLNAFLREVQVYVKKHYPRREILSVDCDFNGDGTPGKVKVKLLRYDGYAKHEKFPSFTDGLYALGEFLDKPIPSTQFFKDKHQELQELRKNIKGKNSVPFTDLKKEFVINSEMFLGSNQHVELLEYLNEKLGELRRLGILNPILSKDKKFYDNLISAVKRSYEAHEVYNSFLDEYFERYKSDPGELENISFFQRRMDDLRRRWRMIASESINLIRDYLEITNFKEIESEDIDELVKISNELMLDSISVVELYGLLIKKGYHVGDDGVNMLMLKMMATKYERSINKSKLDGVGYAATQAIISYVDKGYSIPKYYENDLEEAIQYYSNKEKEKKESLKVIDYLPSLNGTAKKRFETLRDKRIYRRKQKLTKEEKERVIELLSDFDSEYGLNIRSFAAVILVDEYEEGEDLNPNVVPILLNLLKSEYRGIKYFTDLPDLDDVIESLAKLVRFGVGDKNAIVDEIIANLKNDNKVKGYEAIDPIDQILASENGLYKGSVEALLKIRAEFVLRQAEDIEFILPGNKSDGNRYKNGSEKNIFKQLKRVDLKFNPNAVSKQPEIIKPYLDYVKNVQSKIPHYVAEDLFIVKKGIPSEIQEALVDVVYAKKLLEILVLEGVPDFNNQIFYDPGFELEPSNYRYAFFKGKREFNNLNLLEAIQALKDDQFVYSTFKTSVESNTTIEQVVDELNKGFKSASDELGMSIGSWLSVFHAMELRQVGEPRIRYMVEYLDLLADHMDLNKAAKDRDLENVKVGLAKDLDINYVDEFDKTVLDYANDLTDGFKKDEIIQLLKEKGAKTAKEVKEDQEKAELEKSIEEKTDELGSVIKQIHVTPMNNSYGPNPEYKKLWSEKERIQREIKQAEMRIAYNAAKAQLYKDKEMLGAEKAVASKKLEENEEETADTAQLANPGGIDMNKIDVDRIDGKSNFQYESNAINNLIDPAFIQGFTPVIINISQIPFATDPVKSVPGHLEFHNRRSIYGPQTHPEYPSAHKNHNPFLYKMYPDV